MRLNKLEESIADFVRVREKVAGDLDAGVSLAAVYLHLGRIAEARTVYEDILKRDVRNFRALAGLNIIAFGEVRTLFSCICLSSRNATTMQSPTRRPRCRALRYRARWSGRIYL